MDALFETFLTGGWSIVLISLCLLIEVVIIVERSLYLRAASVHEQHFIVLVRKVVLAGELTKAIKLCSAVARASLARVVKAGLMQASHPPERVQAAMDEVASEEISGLMGRTPMLKGLGMLAVLIGLLDSIFNMVSHSHGWWESPLIRLSSQFSGALGSTVLGMAVGLVGIVGFALLGAWRRKLEGQIHHGSAMVLNLLQSREELEDPDGGRATYAVSRS